MLYLLLGKKKCKNCGKLNHKDVLFCWLCGRSFDLRICVSGHQNPAWVQYCRTCGKDRTLMSRPHETKQLNFSRHPTKQLTYVPSGTEGDRVVTWILLWFGLTIFMCASALLIWYGLRSGQWAQ